MTIDANHKCVSGSNTWSMVPKDDAVQDVLQRVCKHQAVSGVVSLRDTSRVAW